MKTLAMAVSLNRVLDSSHPLQLATAKAPPPPCPLAHSDWRRGSAQGFRTVRDRWAASVPKTLMPCARQMAAAMVVLAATFGVAHGQGNTWTNEIPAEKAKSHVHERAEVYGRVYNVSWDDNVYIDFGGVFSDAVFTAVLPGANELVPQLRTLEGKEIVVHGRITTNAFGVPQIRVKSGRNILMVGADNHAVPLDLDPEPSAAPTNSAPASPADTTSWISIFAADPDETNTFVTLSGRTYDNAKVIQVEPDGITIKYAPNGVGLSEVKLTFDDLPANIQQMYGYDAHIAAAYANERQVAADLSDAEKRREAWQARHEAWLARSGEARELYERKKRLYEDEKHDYDEKMRRGEWPDAERLAEAKELAIRDAEYQSAMRQQQLIQQQQQIISNQQTNAPAGN